MENPAPLAAADRASENVSFATERAGHRPARERLQAAPPGLPRQRDFNAEARVQAAAIEWSGSLRRRSWPSIRPTAAGDRRARRLGLNGSESFPASPISSLSRQVAALISSRSAPGGGLSLAQRHYHEL